MEGKPKRKTVEEIFENNLFISTKCIVTNKNNVSIKGWMNLRKLVTDKEIADLVQPFWRRKLEHASKMERKIMG